MVDYSKTRLGKKPAIHDPRTLLLADYLLPKLPRIPAAKNLGRRVKYWHTMENDRLADCTIAAAGHLMLEWTTRAGKAALLHNNAILWAYQDVSGLLVIFHEPIGKVISERRPGAFSGSC